MAGKVVNSNFVLLRKFVTSRQENASKTATSHIHKPLEQRKPEQNSGFLILSKGYQSKLSLFLF